MKKFLLKILSFVLILLAVASILQLLISFRIRNKTTTGHDNFHIIKDHKDELIFLGSSRCLEHFDPKIFKDSLGINAINLGVNGHSDLTMQTLRLQYYLIHNAPPKVAVLSFDPLTLPGSYSIEDNTDFFEKDFFARYAFFPQKEDKLITTYFHYNFAERYIPLYAILRYRLMMDCILMNRLDSWVKIGYEKHDEQWDTVAHPLDRKFFFDHYAFNKLQSNNDTIKSHLNILYNLCKQNHIKLICVQTPVYKDIYDPGAFVLPEKMCSELGILFINTNTDSMMNDRHNFSNANHLNTTGVIKTMNTIIKNKDFLEAMRK